MEKLQHLEYIEAYLEERLSKEERQHFEERLQSDSVLKEEYDAYRATMKLLEFMAIDDLKQSQSTFITTGSNSSYLKRWTIAAGILFLLLGGLVLFANLAYSNERLAAQAYSAPNLASIVRGGQLSEAENTAIQAFLSDNYEKTIEVLSSTSEKSKEAQFLTGLAYFKKGQASQAVAAFQNMLSDSLNERRVSTEWYLTLAHLMNDDLEAAKLSLEQILSQSSNPNFDKAVELQKKLNSKWRILVW